MILTLKYIFLLFHLYAYGGWCSAVWTGSSSYEESTSWQGEMVWCRLMKNWTHDAEGLKTTFTGYGSLPHTNINMESTAMEVRNKAQSLLIWNVYCPLCSLAEKTKWSSCACVYKSSSVNRASICMCVSVSIPISHQNDHCFCCISMVIKALSLSVARCSLTSMAPVGIELIGLDAIRFSRSLHRQ